MYRYLEIGDVIRKGDEFSYKNSWMPCQYLIGYRFLTLMPPIRRIAEDTTSVEVIFTDPRATLERAQQGDAGYDLRAMLSDNQPIRPGESCIFSTGVRLNISNPNIAVLVLPRSGLGINHRVTLTNSVGLIDSGYQGEIKVSLSNEGPWYMVSPLERIAQLVFILVRHPNLEPVEIFREATARGAEGFGSTGRA